MPTLIPHDARIIVRPLEEETVRPSGLVIADTAKQKPTRGQVIAVGPGAFSERLGSRIPLPFAVGDVVVYDRFSGLEWKRTGEDTLVVLRAHDVLATEVSGG